MMPKGSTKPINHNMVYLYGSHFDSVHLMSGYMTK
jgi:hypothetical protein